MGYTINGAPPSSGSSLPAASGANEIPVSSGAGTTYVATAASGVRAAIAAASNQATRTTTYTFADATGWTLTNNAGTASVTSGVLRLDVSATDTGDNGPRGHCDLGAVADPWAVRIAYRVAAHTGGSASSQGRLTLQSTSATTGASAKRLALRTHGDGRVDLQIFPVAGPAVNSIVEAPAGTLVYDGDDWLILQVLGGVVTAWRARGSGGGHTLPAKTTWVLLGYGGTSPPDPILSGSAMTNASPPVVASGASGGCLQAWDRLVFELVTFAVISATYDVDDVSILDLLP